jgi:phospholipid/cholesterol/gamma-HCH transport system substrate-binding protein
VQITRAEKVRLGVFIITTLVLLAVVLFYMIGKRLVTKEDIYFVKYSESVDGLLPAASVKLNGVVVGKVKELFVDSSNVRVVIVRFGVRHGTPIKTDMVANLTGGLTITGLKTIELTGGSNEAPDIPPGGEIKAGISQLKMLTGQAEAIALKFETLLNNILNITNEENQATAVQILRKLSSISYELDSLITGNRDVIWNIPKNISVTMKKLQTASAKAEKLMSEIESANPGKKLDQTLSEFQAVGRELREKVKKTEVDKTVKEFQNAAKNITKVSGKLSNTIDVIQEDLATIMANIKESADNMEDFTRMIKENPSLLLRTEDKKERGL